MTKEELKKEVEEYLHKNYCCKGSYCGFNAECKEGIRIRCSEFEILEKHIINFAEPREKQIQIDAEQIRALQKHNGELTDELKNLRESVKNYGAGCYENGLRNGKRAAEKDIERQGELLEKMKCCANCRFGYCERSSELIDKDGNRTFHCWNEEKEKYCDVGKNGKYQCWEIKEK